MKRIVMFSGGIGSWAAAKRTVERHGLNGLVLLFCDTRSEDEDTYRFLRDAAANIGAPLVCIADGRTIWQVFSEQRFLGNTRVDLCSRVLKREIADNWISDNFEPSGAEIVVGIDWSEEHRFTRMAARKLPWVYIAPLCDAPFLTKTQMHEWAEREGIPQQRLYRMGASHANCGGGCVKMGIGGFSRLLVAWPERFAEWESNEERLRDQLGDVAILRDRTGGTTKPLSLRLLRERIELGAEPDLFDIGGCGCFVDAEPAAQPEKE